MAGLHFELVSPAKLLFSGDVISVVLPGAEGEMTIMAQSAPLLTTLKPGVLVIAREGQAVERVFVRGGFAEVNPKGLTVLAETAILMSDLDAAALAREIKNADEDVADATDPEKKRKAEENLNYLKDLQKAL